MVGSVRDIGIDEDVLAGEEDARELSSAAEGDEEEEEASGELVWIFVLYLSPTSALPEE